MSQPMEQPRQESHTVLSQVSANRFVTPPPMSGDGASPLSQSPKAQFDRYLTEVSDRESIATSDHRFVFHLAMEYWERGWSLIPLQGKTPALSSWKEFQRRTPTPKEIEDWFAGTTPQHTNIGIVTGRVSGLVVIDCDSVDAGAHWLASFPQTSVVVETGGGGKHLYYRSPDTVIGNRIGIGGRKIDVRGEGGYVVAPPSRHPNGNLYSWASPPTYCLDDVPIFNPAWLAPSRPTRTGSTGRISNGPGYIRHIRAVAGNGGHNATFRAACALRDAGLTPEEALAELFVWNHTNADPPWSPRELLHKVKSAYAQGHKAH